MQPSPPNMTGQFVLERIGALTFAMKCKMLTDQHDAAYYLLSSHSGDAYTHLVSLINQKKLLSAYPLNGGRSMIDELRAVDLMRGETTTLRYPMVFDIRTGTRMAVKYAMHMDSVLLPGNREAGGCWEIEIEPAEFERLAQEVVNQAVLMLLDERFTQEQVRYKNERRMALLDDLIGA